MINNLEVLKPILFFDDDLYVMVIIMSRFKDGHRLQKPIAKNLFFGSFESLQNEMPNIIEIAEEKKARVYVDTISKRLSDNFLSSIEWERFKLFGIKPQSKKKDIDIDFYGLYDADEYSVEYNDIIKNYADGQNMKPLIIKSSAKGEHWLFKLSDLHKILDDLNGIIHTKIFTTHAWACLYNPF